MRRLITVLTLAVLAVGLVGGSALAVVGNIKNTKHDLSAGNTTYTVKAAGEDEVCVFCHTPHNASKKVPLWNHSVTTSTFLTYSSATIDGTTSLVTSGDPVNVSVLCLSCHDGSVALGSVVKNYSGNSAIGAIAGKTDASGKLISPAALGTDLSNDHPVGITYVTTPGDLRGPTGSKVISPTDSARFCQLFGTTAPYTVECASCHAVHGGTGAEPFLRFSNTNSTLCLTCHLK